MPGRPIAVGTSDATTSVDGRRFLWAIAGAIAAAGLTGTAAWFGFRGLLPSIESAVVTQIVVAVVYGTLIATFGACAAAANSLYSSSTFCPFGSVKWKALPSRSGSCAM